MASPSSSCSDSSYHTAHHPSSPMAVDAIPKVIAKNPVYRPAIPVPKEVTHLVHIYFDEKIYTSALSLITGLITSGTSHPDRLTVPAFTPLPIHIEVVSVLLVHPRYTTHASRNERAELSSRCISFLRDILSNLGPLSANLAEAFSFSDTRGRGSRRRHGEDTSSDDEEEFTKLKGIVANQGRIRQCATDFWQVVGWALNCSVAHRKRWKYWKVWLEYMLDVLDEDWNERERQDQAASSDDADNFKFRRTSILVSYLASVKGGRSTPLKRVVGSIFVDGGTHDLRAYPEVFPNETLEVKSQNGQKRKREDEDNFGDYDNDEDDLEFDSEMPTPSQDSDNGNGTSAPDPWLGGSHSIALRQRLLVLLSRVGALLPEEFVNCIDLYSVYCDNMKFLPLPAFTLMFSPCKSSRMPSEVYVSLSQFFLARLLPNFAPRPRTVSRRDGDDLSQVIIEKCFLPFTANTSATDDNAMVSILVEGMLRLVMRSARVYHTPDLDFAVEKGILARENKVKSDRRKDNRASKKEEEEDRLWLTASGKRLRGMLAWVEKQHYSDED